MFNNLFRNALAILASTTLVACTEFKSDELTTKAMNADYVISAESETTVHCAAYFTGGSGGINTTTVDLVSGDSVSCNGAMMSRQEDSITRQISYVADVPAKVGDTVQIVFHRNKEGDFASKVIIPDAINLTSQPKTFTKSSSMTFTYTPSIFTQARLAATINANDPNTGKYNMDPNGHRIDAHGLRIKTDMTGGASDGNPEHGTVTLRDEFPEPAPYATGAWPGHIWLIRSIRGTTDPGFNAKISAQQRLHLDVTVTD